MRGGADNSGYISSFCDSLHPNLITVDDGYIILFRGQMAGNGTAYNPCTANDNFHACSLPVFMLISYLLCFHLCPAN